MAGRTPTTNVLISTWRVYRQHLVGNNPINVIDPWGLEGSPPGGKCPPPKPPCKKSYDDCYNKCRDVFGTTWYDPLSYGLGAASMFMKGGAATGAGFGAMAAANISRNADALCKQKCKANPCWLD